MQKGSYTVVENAVVSLFAGSFLITSILTLPLMILDDWDVAGFVSHPVSHWGDLDNADYASGRCCLSRVLWASFKKHHSNMDTLVALEPW